MTNDRPACCPGCGKHCSLKSPGCYFGVRFSEKLKAEEGGSKTKK